MSRKRKANKRNRDDEAIAAAVHEGLQAMGWTPPQTDDDVRRAEAALAESPAPLPEELRDAKAVFDGAGKTPQAAPKPLVFPVNPEIDATLNRASREPGHLTPEIEEIMRRDREAAERRLNEAEDAQENQ